MEFTYYKYGKSSNENIAYITTPQIMSCSNKMNGSNNADLTYSKAPLIERVFNNPNMKAPGVKIMNESPKICAIATNICVIPNLRCYKYLEPRE